MVRGFATINHWTDDLEAARGWYAELLGVEPYFERPGPDGRLAYAEFRIGHYQHELGLVDPFGNVLGIMHNPHYLEILQSSGRA
jgi:catechol 2,3-dioxygenase-like lactoylglutathione lyase family enzyme